MMKTKLDYSYGVIPVHTDANGTNRVLVIHQYSSVKDDYYWVFPKGHPEEGEVPEETAKRELKEETGLDVTRLSTETLTMQYCFSIGDTEIDKRVVYYLGWVIDTSLSLQAEEVREAAWLVLDEAEERLTYENAKAILQTARLLLEDSGEKD